MVHALMMRLEYAMGNERLYTKIGASHYLLANSMRRHDSLMRDWYRILAIVQQIIVSAGY
jgi:hypothetical protein